MRLLIYETPIAQKRPRFYRGIVYDPQKIDKRRWKSIISTQMIENGYCAIHSEPIHATLIFYMPIAKSLSKRKQIALDKKPHITRSVGDLDNLIKFVLDVMNDIVYEDDALVYKIEAKKMYDFNPRVEINITCGGS